MKFVTVKIQRDRESPDWWLARFRFGGRSYCTQGAVVDEARYMAADLLKMQGADEDTVVTFAYDDRESLPSLLARPVTPSLISDVETDQERVGATR
jgi:hypothetical protein